MKTIWKFTLDPFAPNVEMPRGAEVIHVHEQNGHVRLWAEVDPDEDVMVTRSFAPVMTGNSVPDGAVYIGSAHIKEDELMIVVHVYETTNSPRVSRRRPPRPSQHATHRATGGWQ